MLKIKREKLNGLSCCNIVRGRFLNVIRERFLNVINSDEKVIHREI